MADRRSVFQPTLDPAHRQLRLFLANDVDKFLVLENLTLIAKPTVSVLRAGTLSRSPWRLDPLPRPLKVVLKSFDHRVAFQLRNQLKIPQWNARREAIYRSLSSEEAARRLASLPKGDRMFLDFQVIVSGRYTEPDGEGGYLDRSAQEVDDGLIADEELFVQRLCFKLWRAEADSYRILQQEQGRAIPYCFEAVVHLAREGILEPKTFLTACPGLLLEGIRGCTVKDSLTCSSKLPGQNIGPLLSKALITLNILISHEIWIGDLQLRNMILCTRSLGERRKDIEQYRWLPSATERGDDEQDPESIVCGDELPTLEGCSTEMVTQDGEQGGPIIMSSFSQGTIDDETSYVVFVDLEQWYVEKDTHQLARMTPRLVKRFKIRCSALNIPDSVWRKTSWYIDGRFVNYSTLRYRAARGSTLLIRVGKEHQRTHDIIIAALCWANTRPMDSMEKYSACYNISQRGWRIMREEIKRYRGPKEDWWRRAVRRIAVELFSDDPDEVENRFKVFLGAPPFTASQDSISITQLFTKSKDTWRQIEGPPPFHIPG